MTTARSRFFTVWTICLPYENHGEWFVEMSSFYVRLLVDVMSEY